MKEKVLGISWLVLGIVLSVYLTIHLVSTFIDGYQRTNILIFYLTQSIFPIFGVIMAFCGYGSLKYRERPLMGIQILSVFGVIYCFSYALLGAHNIVGFLIGFLGVGIFAISVFMAHSIRKSHYK